MQEDKRTSFEKLKGGIVLYSLKCETEEPELYAIGHFSDKTARWSRISEYAFDIERIKKELDLSLSLIKDPPEENFLEAHNIPIEDYLMYHQGYFLELVHQLKEKLFRLIDALATEGKYGEEEEREVKIKTLIKKVESLKISGLSVLLKVWEQESRSPIGVVLKRRTKYHHFRNKLILNPDFINVKLNRTFQKDVDQKLFTEGIGKIIKKRSEESMKKWHSELTNKIEVTIKAVEENIERISDILIKHFNLPVTAKDVTDITKEQEKLYEALQIKNTSSLDNINPYFISVIEAVKEKLTTFEVAILSAYIVGSIVRGDARPGFSDINLVIIIKKEQEKVIDEIKELMENVSISFGQDIDTKILTENEFANELNKKIRFICKTDGLTLTGENFVQYEKFPKPGLVLAWILNRDFREKIYMVKKILEGNQHLTQELVNKIAKTISKDIFRLMFAEVMSNKAVYKKTLDEMKPMLEMAHPENKEIIEMTYLIAKGEGLIEKNSLENLLIGAEKNLFPLLDQIEQKNIGLKEAKKYR